MRNANDVRLDIVLSKQEKEALMELAGFEGPSNWIKRLINIQIKERKLSIVPFQLRRDGRPKGRARAKLSHGQPSVSPLPVHNVVVE